MRPTLSAITISLTAVLGLGSAEAGNGSNYVHLMNGVDYFFLSAPTSGSLRGVWRCFPGENLIAPTLVTDPANPQVGTYAAKICAIHMTVTGSPAGPLLFPTVSISTSDGKCQFTQSGGTALNFGLASSGAGLVVVGPLAGNGTPASNLALQVTLAGASITNPASAPNVLVQLALNLTQIVGSPSTIPVPEGDSMTLWLQENDQQTGAGNRMYWTGSLNERNLCSGYSFLLSGNGSIGIGFNAAWEWSAGIGTLDATMTPAITSVGSAQDGLLQPFDQGTGTTTISITGATAFPATSTVGDAFGFAHYDESNAFGGSDKLVILNLAGLESSGNPVCSNRAPTFVQLPTGGPGGPVLSPLGNAPRSAAKFDGVTSALLGGGFWTAATVHGGVPGGINIPWFAAPAGISGSTGNTGGFMIPIPPLATLVGIQVYTSMLSLNGAGTAIAPLANNGHSHTNGYATLFFP